MKYDWNDVSIVPETLSTIASRKEINPLIGGRLPLFTAPMDKVIDGTKITNQAAVLADFINPKLRHAEASTAGSNAMRKQLN